MEKREKYRTVYGTIEMERGFCHSCNTWSIIIDKEFQCCGETVKKRKINDRIIFMSPSVIAHRTPNKSIKYNQLEKQDYKCIYCGETLTYALAQCDHFVPFSVSRNNKRENIVVTCKACNYIKTNKIFESIEEAREYVLKKREEKERKTKKKV